MTFTIPLENGNGVKNAETGSKRTLYPYVTGTSVVAIKYRDGILMASDMGGSYGSTLRYKNIERMKGPFLVPVEKSATSKNCCVILMNSS